MSEINNIIISKLQQGDQKTWREIVDRLSDQLFGYALSLCSDHSIASDIVQQAFISLYEYRFKLKPDYPLKSFLYKTVYNKFINYYHKEKSLSRLHEQYHHILQEYLNTNSDDYIKKRIQIINLIIEDLPKKTKKVFILKKKRGFSNEEISINLSISVKTVEAHITKAFRLIKEKANQSKQI